MQPRTKTLLPLAIVASCLIAEACSSFNGDGAPGATTDDGGAGATVEDGTPTVPGTPARGLELIVGDPASTAYIVQGQPLSLKVTLTRKLTTTGPVAIIIKTLPPDVTADPLQIPAGQVTGTLLLHAAATSAQGPAPLDVVALEDGPEGAGATTKVNAFVRGAPGALDTTFGTLGFVRHIYGGSKQSTAKDLVILDDDRVGVVAQCMNSASTYACVMNFSAQGVVDKTYGTAGIGALDISLIGQAGVDALGRVLVSGNGGAGSFKVGRLTAIGGPDPSFGNVGSVNVGVIQLSPSGGGPLEGATTSLVTRKDGTTVIGFGHAVQRGPKVGLQVLDAKGASLDSFGMTGSSTAAVTSQVDSPPSIGARTNGDIWFAYLNGSGYVDQQKGDTGIHDPAFGGVNLNSIGVGGTNRLAIGAAATRADGSIVIAAQGGSGQALVGKYLPNGVSADIAWGDNGVAVIATTAVPSICIGKDDLVLVALKEAGGLRLARLASDGSLDPTFGQGGMAVHSFGMNQQMVRALLQKDGRIVVLGTEDFTDGTDASLTRYWN